MGGNLEDEKNEIGKIRNSAIFTIFHSIYLKAVDISCNSLGVVNAKDLQETFQFGIIF